MDLQKKIKFKYVGSNSCSQTTLFQVSARGREEEPAEDEVMARTVGRRCSASKLNAISCFLEVGHHFLMRSKARGSVMDRGSGE